MRYNEFGIDGGPAAKSLGPKLDVFLEHMSVRTGLQVADEEDEKKQLAKSERVAIHVSNIANLVLFMAKVYASVESRSLTALILDYSVVNFSCHENPKPVSLSNWKEEDATSDEYVICNGCKSPDTILSKENRLFFLRCEKKARYLPFFHVLNEKVVEFFFTTYLRLWPMMFKFLPTLSDSIINEEESKAILRPVDISYYNINCLFTALVSSFRPFCEVRYTAGIYRFAEIGKTLL
ncbi:hypothetical protein RHMOL_Rhmol13G0160200 [Rhododendron molle]|uniref:Uncharacterized protein n=2 Tax=Rhododendron molle TaxID=49168 RepID=A0ACC0L7S1_RHOML|nr:hypothetical protein RHMOL_Rhmol13G0160200 [Rhododendron molle]KAI8524580.1 hypothetical protein RHMOL_Rhmol13G0160200 [Rhododendron molle]